MEAARTRWTDERIDDVAGRLARFEERVDESFDRADSRLHSWLQTIFLAMTSVLVATIAQHFLG